MSASTEYISASVNRYNHAAACNTSSLIAYGSGSLVTLWDAADPSERGVHQTLAGHTSRVTCVDFINEQHLISGDDAGIVKIWRNADDRQWSEIISLQTHKKSISGLAYHAVSGHLFVGSSDSRINVWLYDQANTKLSHLQDITLKNRYPLSIALATLPYSSSTILAVGCTDRSVQVYTRSTEHFVYATSLPGHEDWIRALAFLPPNSPSTPLILASGSQDATIRLWNIEPLTAATKAESTADADELLDTFEASLGETGERDEGGRQITLKRHIVRAGDAQYSLTFDALLVGHEAGVTSLAWRPASSETPTPTLLSSSTDSSIILWSPAAVPTLQKGEETALWISRERFGDVGGQRLGGFVGSLWAAQGKEVIAWGWSGGCRRWRLRAPSATVESETWIEAGAISGHLGPVRAVSWAPGGEYLFSAGVDQTTRVHGAIPTASGATWHELARPQVHGYDLVGVTALSPLSFVSIADEKVARAFEAPAGFVKTARALQVAQLEGTDVEKMPASAVVPPLGLSNKAYTDAASQAVPISQDSSSRRPFEGELASATLWPETEKIFGHGYESISLASSTTRSLIATACKATTAQHAVVRVYEVPSFRAVGKPLEGHSLTVTRIDFSPDDTKILSVSRDRTWHLSERQEDGGYVPVAADKSHARIIWDCSWAPEGDLFATASRDKTVRVWRLKDDRSKKWSSVATLKLDEAATAVAFAPGEKNRRVLAVGLETGEILLYSCELSSSTEWEKLLAIPRGIAHIDHIHQLAWRPLNDLEPSKDRVLASCSDDGTLRILRVVV